MTDIYYDETLEEFIIPDNPKRQEALIRALGLTDGRDGIGIEEIEQVAPDKIKIELTDETEYEIILPCGERGEKGERGEIGPQGLPGIDGKDGESIVGPAGKDGRDGKDGKDGKAIATSIVDVVQESKDSFSVVLSDKTKKTFQLPKVKGKGVSGGAGQDTYFRSGEGTPNAGLGVLGDHYFDKTDSLLYGPKTGAGWGAGVSVGGGGGTPGGSDTQVQFNDGGLFGGDAGFTYNKTTDSVSVVGSILGYSATDWGSGGGDVWIARAGNNAFSGAIGLFWDSALLGVYLRDDTGATYPLTASSINVSSLSLPNVGLNQVAANISGEIAGDAGFEYDSFTNSLLVASATFTPARKIHVDGGDATASFIKFTAGTTTGQLASDGVDIGISSAGALQIIQREALNIDFFTNGTNNWRIASAGHLVGASDNNYDIGQSGATRPRHVYVAQNITAGSTISGGTLSASSAANITGPVSITRTTLYVSSDGFNAAPVSATTGVTAALIPLNVSPRSRLTANAWDIDGAANNIHNFWNEVIPYPGNTTNAKLSWTYAIGTLATAAEYQAPEIMNYYNYGLNVLGNTYGTENLTNGALTSGTSWAVANGFSLTVNTAVYVHNASGGTLTQTAANFAVPVKANRWYRFTWTSSALNTTANCWIDPTGISAERVYLRGTVVTPGTYTTTFKTNAAPGDFILSANSAAASDGFTLDTLSLVEITSGDVIANGKFTGGGTLGLKIDQAGVVTSDAVVSPSANDGAALGTTALQWSDLFLAEGGVINWDNGDVTITQTGNLLAFAGASTAYTFDAPIRLKGYTVATLPAGTQGNKAFVTDALGPTYLVTVVGGGAIVAEVFYNGTNWVCT